jgi:signal transduction histidine kinase
LPSASPADPRTKRGLALLDPGGRAVFATGLLPEDPGTVYVVAPITARGQVVGGVRVVKPTIVVRRLVEDFAPFVLVVSLVLGITAALAANQSGRAIARPIEALTEFAVHVSEGERRATPPPVHGREVQRLSRAIDSMRRQIEGRPFVETFAADLSHELKNPVAAIRASAEVLADGALDEPEEAARFVGRIQEATTRIDALLGDLLSLARIEARGVEEATSLDLGDVASEAVARARDHGDPVVLEIAGAVPVRGDARWLARALDNLLDNARAHGESGSPVRVAVRRDGERGVLEVENAGEVHDHVKKRLFRRFTTTREGKGGTGLGLAIVRAIVEAHGGSVECTKLGPPGVTFALTLPVA